MAGVGSSFAVSRKGHLVTNEHVIAGCQALRILHKGEVFKANVVNADKRNDLALLKSEIQPSRVFSINRDGADLLDKIIVAGFGFGYEVSKSVKATTGSVSSLVGIGDDAARFQIDASMQTGNSGGPILDSDGRVVGVATEKWDEIKRIKSGKSFPQLINFGVKSSILVEMLKANGLKKYSKSKLRTNDEIRAVIKDSVYLVVCYMTEKRRQQMAQKRRVFQTLKYDFK